MSQASLAQYKIGLMYFLGDGVRQSFEHAFTYFKLAADDRCFSAELALAYLYYTGQGVEKSFFKALEYYAKTADHPKCQLGIAKLYHHGHDAVLQDIAEAIIWYKRAAVEKKDADAQYALGRIYSDGELGIKIDYSEAMFWFSQAAYRDHVDSNVSMGLLYFDGLGVKQDIYLAHGFFDKALSIDREHGLANYHAARCYIAESNDSHPELIISHYAKAADSHHSGASFAIGRYYEGQLTEKNNIEKAAIWYRRAMDDGPHDFAERSLNRLKQTKIVVQHNHVPPTTVVENKPDAVKHTSVTSSTTTATLPNADVKSKYMAQLEEELKRIRLIGLKLKQRLELREKELLKMEQETKEKLESHEKERLRMEQELKEKDEFREKERLRTEQESKEKDELIRILTIEKEKMQKFQMQLVLNMAQDGNKSSKRMRNAIDY